MLLHKLLNYKAVGILTHANPDADALGSCFALQMVLGSQRAKVVLDGKPTSAVFLEFGYEELEPRVADFDALVVVDAHQKSRLGKWEDFVGDFDKDIFVIDHHQLADDKLPCVMEIIDSGAVSAGVLIFRLCQRMVADWQQEKRAKFARAIYYTILGDTNGFQNRNLDADCFAVCASLLEMGLNPGQAYEDFFCQMSLAGFTYLAEVYAGLHDYENGKIVFAFSDLQLQERLGFAYDELPDVVGRLKELGDYEIIVLYKEKEAGSYKLSFRSKTADVQSICKKLGGGGHRLAAGCEVSGQRAKIEKEVLELCRQKL